VLDPPPSVRLVVPKGSQKSKGCAFVEFTHPNALQQGLKLHHSTLEGRKLNVELTVGGGGKGVDRLNRLRERNKTLNDQRVCPTAIMGIDRIEDVVLQNKQRSRSTGVIGDSSKGVAQTAPSRLSLTSGMDTAPENKKTWSADDTKPKRKRGNQRHASKHLSQRAPRPCTLTGANAVMVG
jgi:nucleolar protein 6